MSHFPGFPSGKLRMISMPEAFFTQLLPQINNLEELKVTLYAFWFLSQQEGSTRYITFQDFTADQVLMKSMHENPDQAFIALTDALDCAVSRGSLLAAQLKTNSTPTSATYFLNTERGRAAVKAIRSGDWNPSAQAQMPVSLEAVRPNIFQLYEENIGPLTPLIAEDLQEAEKLYPQEWIEEAIHKAIQNNVRRWRYIETILESWQEEGRHDTYRKNPEEDHLRYIKGEFGEIGEY